VHDIISYSQYLIPQNCSLKFHSASPQASIKSRMSLATIPLKAKL